MFGTKEFKLRDLDITSNDDGVFNRIQEEYGEWINDLSVRIDKEYGFTKICEEGELASKTDTNRPKATYEKIFSKLKARDHLTMSEVASVSWPMVKIYEYVRFEPSEYKLKESQKDELNNKISGYLGLLENDALKINRRNYYRFDIQKKLLIDRIEKGELIKKYGNNFVSSEIVDYSGISARDSHLLFVQTVYALADIGYLTVFDAWGETDYTDKEKIYRVSLNVEVHDTLLAELKQEYQKQNPKNLLEKFDAKSGVLKFAGQEILLGKKGKETDAIRLMKTLTSIEPDEWIERGEVYMDWGLSKDDRDQMAKNKIYYAKQAINEAIARKTQIEDFIEGGTIKWRINPRYRKKVDE